MIWPSQSCIMFTSTFFYEGAEFLVRGSLYSKNSSINISTIQQHVDALRCLTPLRSCCRNTHGMTIGNWRFPNGRIVPSSGNKAYVNRGPGSVNLNKISSMEIPSGIYTCEIPDATGTLTKLNTYLYIGQLPGKEITY